MNQLAKKHRQQLASFVIVLRPIMDLSGLDGQKTGNVGASRHGLLFPAPIMAVERGLKIKQLLSVGAERLFQPEGHSGGQ